MLRGGLVGLAHRPEETDAPKNGRRMLFVAPAAPVTRPSCCSIVVVFTRAGLNGFLVGGGPPRLSYYWLFVNWFIHNVLAQKAFSHLWEWDLAMGDGRMGG